MSKELAVVVTVAAGGAVAAQAPINNVLSKHVGTFGAASVNFLVGTACLLLVTFALAGGFNNPDSEGAPPLLYWILGGIAGVIIVTTTLITVRELGAGGVTAAIVAGQLTASVALDRLGVLGLDERAITAEKMLGIALLAVGTFLIVRD